MDDKKYDVFISHASEDKDTIVRPLVTALERIGVRVWYDEFSLQLGDSLTASIDKGLQDSNYGLVVLSQSFLGKNWPDYEYRSLLTREINGEKVILPLWYGVTKAEVQAFSLFLVDIKGISINEENIRDTVFSVLRVIRPDIWQELRMRSVLRNAIAEGSVEMVKISDIKSQTFKQSHLTRQQYIRSKAVFYGIGIHMNQTFDDYVEQFELDVVPERELQTWEIMNACYLEMLERHKDASEKDKRDYYKVLIALSVGLSINHNICQCDDTVNELLCLWQENYYEF